MAATPKLNGIQALRGVAAVAVILYHVARHLDRAHGTPALMRIFQAGHAGVDLFFVLSGFIILFVHGRDIGRPARLPHYARQRLTRVWPIYWVALAATVVLAMLGTTGPPDPARLIWSVTLLPSAQPPVLGLAWSLRFEIVFYAIFALLILNRTLGIAALIGWAAVLLFLPAGAAPGALAGQLRDPYNLHFFLGMAVACAARRAIPAPGPGLCAADPGAGRARTNRRTHRPAAARPPRRCVLFALSVPVRVHGPRMEVLAGDRPRRRAAGRGHIRRAHRRGDHGRDGDGHVCRTPADAPPRPPPLTAPPGITGAGFA
ncbi:acyltransferase family protein [Sphingomonas montana]|uniref:acyltransferase family protein n=1 Tax=Sphingomonas montana TaxID=1843236 RepID=UPI00096F60D7|nr:acyltransferase [Sphingomonas montana]